MLPLFDKSIGLLLLALAVCAGCARAELPPTATAVRTGPPAATATMAVTPGATASAPSGTPTATAPPATQTPSPASTAGAAQYTVVAGDTIWAIAVKFGLTAD